MKIDFGKLYFVNSGMGGKFIVRPVEKNGMGYLCEWIIPGTDHQTTIIRREKDFIGEVVR